ncbi:MAG: hypothetical protein BWX87_02798 [Bacteroidetes bacterium ADurb.Bin123]|nr:MAG: hypothetical protein BWX87_02798 [Bacteroidetes bacterium ADurb.Bin123]
MPDRALEQPNKRIEPENGGEQFGKQQVSPVFLTNVHRFVSQDAGKFLLAIHGRIVKHIAEKGKGQGIPAVADYFISAVTADSRLVNDADEYDSLDGKPGKNQNHTSQVGPKQEPCEYFVLESICVLNPLPGSHDL